MSTLNFTDASTPAHSTTYSMTTLAQHWHQQPHYFIPLLTRSKKFIQSTYRQNSATGIASLFRCHLQEVLLVDFEESPPLFRGQIRCPPPLVEPDGRLVPLRHQEVHAAAAALDSYLRVQQHLSTAAPGKPAKSQLLSLRVIEFTLPPSSALVTV